MEGYRVLLALLVALVTSVSGCTGVSPAEKAQEQADKAQTELMQKMDAQGVDLQVLAAYEREGNTVLTLRNTGRRTITTSNITVRAEDQDFECRPYKDLGAGMKTDCRTISEFPSADESRVYKVYYAEEEKATYNCSISSEDGVAC